MISYFKRMIKHYQLKRIDNYMDRHEKLLKDTRRSNVIFYKEKKII